MSTSYYGSKKYRRTIYAVSWVLAVFYLVASGRGLFPGLCATQNAMDAQRAQVAGPMLTRGMGICCAQVCTKTRPDDQGNSPRPITPRESGCAFCTLVTTLASVGVAVEAPALQAPAFTPRKTLLSQRPEPFAFAVSDNRAPPA